MYTDTGGSSKLAIAGQWHSLLNPGVYCRSIKNEFANIYRVLHIQPNAYPACSTQGRRGAGLQQVTGIHSGVCQIIRINILTLHLRSH